MERLFKVEVSLDGLALCTCHTHGLCNVMSEFTLKEEGAGWVRLWIEVSFPTVQNYGQMLRAISAGRSEYYLS